MTPPTPPTPTPKQGQQFNKEFAKEQARLAARDDYEAGKRQAANAKKSRLDKTVDRINATADRNKRFDDAVGKLSQSAPHVSKFVPQAQAQTVWSPDSSSILVVGGLLAGANLIVQGAVPSLLSLIWNLDVKKSAQNSQSAERQFWGELGFVFVLYIIGSVYPPATKAILIFLFGLWLIFLMFYGPKLISFFSGK